jgi:hypothetical protein
MSARYPELDLSRLRVFPLAERRSLARLTDILIDPDAPPPPVTVPIAEVATAIRAARQRGAAVILLYGAHLVRNGAASVVLRLIDGGWLTHLATNGAGAIHDFEFALQGQSTESVRAGLAAGNFGTWDETGGGINTALQTGGGYGAAVGRWIVEHEFPHRATSLLAECYRRRVPLTVHPGIGYDITATHPLFDGAAMGRAGAIDFRIFAHTVEHLDSGVVLSVGTAVMGPQVFEKALSCVNTLRV